MRVIFHPTKLNKSNTATSLISGDVKRNDIVIPTGIPPDVNPRKTGMLEQEQNGVIAPNIDPIR
jgi:hypothetical protein